MLVMEVGYSVVLLLDAVDRGLHVSIVLYVDRSLYIVVVRRLRRVFDGLKRGP
jgi:hypothetical protein